MNRLTRLHSPFPQTKRRNTLIKEHRALIES